MNKQDLILISIIVLIAVIILGIFKINEKANSLNALVYYDNNLVLKIDLNKQEQVYEVEGYNGPVYISAGDGRVKVEDEDSPLHLCQKQGYISKSYESIICLPNKIVVKIDAKEEVDTVIK